MTTRPLAPNLAPQTAPVSAREPQPLPAEAAQSGPVAPSVADARGADALEAQASGRPLWRPTPGGPVAPALPSTSAIDKLTNLEGALRGGVERLSAELRTLETENEARTQRLDTLTGQLRRESQRLDDLVFAKALLGTTLTIFTGGLLPVGLAIVSGKRDGRRIDAIEAQLRAVRTEKAGLTTRIAQHRRVRDTLAAKLEQLRTKEVALVALRGPSGADASRGASGPDVVGVRRLALDLDRGRAIVDNLEAQVRLLEELRDGALTLGDALAPLVARLEDHLRAAREAVSTARSEVLGFAGLAVGGSFTELATTVAQRLAGDALEPIVRTEVRALLGEHVRTRAREATEAWVKGAARALPAFEDLPPPGAPRDPAFAALDAVVGDARVVALGEPAHGLHEPAALRNRVFAHLIEHHGFRALTLESGVIEARLVDRFVCDVDRKSGLQLDDVLARGFTHGMGPWEETRALVEWVRTFNDGAAARGEPLVRFVGKDLPREGDTLTAPLGEVFTFLAAAGVAAGPELEQLRDLAARSARVTTRTLEILAAHGYPAVIDPDHLDALTSISFEQLSLADRDALGRGLDALRTELVTNAEAHIAAYQAKTGATRAAAVAEHRWALDMSRVADQLYEDLERRVLHPADAFTDAVAALLERAYAAAGEPPPAINPAKRARLDDPDAIRDFFLGRASRERHLAENVVAAASRYGKVLSFAHNGHVNRAAMGTFIGDVHVQDAAEGQFLARALGRDYLVLGATTGRYLDEEGRARDRVDGVALPVPGPNSLESLFVGAVGPQLVDLRAAPEGPVRDWLGAEQRMRHQWSLEPVIPSACFDALIYVPTSRPGVRSDS